MNKYLLAVGVGVATATAVGLGVLWLKRRVPPPDPESYQTPVAKVARLCVYPVKSCHSVEVESTECLPRGLKYDRCWAIVARDGMVPNLHNTASLSRIQPRLDTAADGSAILYLTAPDMPELVIREPPQNATSTTVHLWGVAGEAVDVGDEAGQWASHFLGKEGCRMVYMSPCHRGRYLRDDTNWADVAKAQDQASFADFSPTMIASEESLELLNSKLDSPIPMDRFRPNIVITGCDPHAEDNWKEIKIGKSLILKGIRHCRRCKVTTVETVLGYYTGQEPLKTLKTYRCRQHINAERRYDKSALFGYYYTILQPGEINVGDTIYIK